MAKRAFFGASAPPQPLLTAACYGDMPALQKELEKKHVRNSINLPDGAAMTALLYATQNGYEEAAALLMHHGATPNCANNLGTTPLMYACEKSLSGAVEKMLTIGVNDIDARETSSGDTAMMKALREDHGWAACRLLQLGAKMDVTNNKGETPASLALECMNPRDYGMFINIAAEQMRARDAAAKAAHDKEVREASTLQRDIRTGPVLHIRPRTPKN